MPLIRVSSSRWINLRTVEYKRIVEAVKTLCTEAAFKLPEDVLSAIKQHQQDEWNETAKDILHKLEENAEIAEKDLIPLCQDTGLAVIFLEIGNNVNVASENNKTIVDAVNEGVKQGYKKGYLRKSVVAEPLKERKNTETNTPAIVHTEIIPGDRIKISLMAKGGGCENKSQFKMFNPTADKHEVIEWVTQVVKEAGANACPPFVIGVGMGGDFELSCILSKKSLLRKIGQRNSDSFYASLEEEILKKVNQADIGPQGFGGKTTALDCKVEFAPCHIASLPVAVNIECHSHRHKTAEL